MGISSKIGYNLIKSRTRRCSICNKLTKYWLFDTNMFLIFEAQPNNCKFTPLQISSDRNNDHLGIQIPYNQIYGFLKRIIAFYIPQMNLSSQIFSDRDSEDL